MGKHSRQDGQECPEMACGHEAHEEGRCYHCGIFSDIKADDHPCIRAFSEDTKENLLWAGEDRGWKNDQLDLR